MFLYTRMGSESFMGRRLLRYKTFITHVHNSINHIDFFSKDIEHSIYKYRIFYDKKDRAHIYEHTFLPKN